ncbi:MAG: tetratricopeptide repeat protein [Pirellulales bacterium]
MRYQSLFVLVLAVSAAGCSGGGWLTRPSWPFAEREKPPQTVSQMLASGSTRSSAPKTEPKKSSKKSRGNDQMAAASFFEQLGNAKATEQAGKQDSARKMYEKLLVEFPDRAEPYHRLGVVADRQRRHREAQSLYTQALLIKPMDPEILNDLGYCFFLQGQLTKAESALMKGVSLSPSDDRIRNNLGMVLGHLGRDEQALEQFRRAGSEADAQYNLAFVQVARGDMEQARRRLELALRNNPSHQQARIALNELDAVDNDVFGVASKEDSGIPPAPSKPGRYVPYLEDVDPSQPNAALTGGAEPMQEVGEGDASLHAAGPHRTTYGSPDSPASVDRNAAVRSLKSSGYTAHDDPHSQALQAQAQQMMEARLR